MLYRIPKTLKIGLLSSEKFIEERYFGHTYSITGKKLFCINPLPKKEATGTKRDAINYYHYQNIKDNIHYVDVPNTGFRLRLNLAHRGYRNYSPMPIIELLHDSFDKLSYQPYITIEHHHLMELLSLVNGNLNNTEFPGTYKLRIISTGRYPTYFFIKEDSLNHLDILSTKYGELAETVKRTSKWIPGYVYTLPDRTTVLYIGKAKNLIKSSYCDYSTTLYGLFNFDSNDLIADDYLGKTRRSINENNAIVINLYRNTQDYSDLLNPCLDPIDMKTFASNFIEDYCANDSGRKNKYLSFYRVIDGKLPRAHCLGKMLNLNSEFSENDILPSFIEDLETFIRNKINNEGLSSLYKLEGLLCSPWLNHLVAEDDSIKYELISRLFSSENNKYIINYHTSKFKNNNYAKPVLAAKVIDSMLNYVSGTDSTWKNNGLVNFTTNLKNLLNNNTRFGNVDKDVIYNIISQLV
jgi:hypothetical protein